MRSIMAKPRLGAIITAIALTAVLAIFIVSTGTVYASTTTGEGGGQLVYLSGDDVNVNVSAPEYLGLDQSAWNFTATGTYGGASADISIVVWIYDGTTNTSSFVLENETLADPANITAYVAIDPSGFVANTTAVLSIGVFVDDNGEYNTSNASDYWTGAVSIEESALLAALNYIMPAIITLAIFIAIISAVMKIIPR